MGARPPSTAGGRVLGSTQPRPPARFSSLRSQEIVNHKQEPWGNTLLAQRYPISGNSYFWRTASRRGARGRRSGLQTWYGVTILSNRFAATNTSYDDFESGLGNWASGASWGLAANHAYTGTYSLTDSPQGNYGNNSDTYALTAVNLTGTVW